MEEFNPVKDMKKWQYNKPFVDSHEPEFTEYDFKVINRLFERLSLIFPAFKQAWPSQKEFDGAKKEWIRAFKLANMFDVDKIKYGIEQFSLKTSPFVPSVGQFIEMCKKINKPAYHQDYVRLTNTCTTKEVAKKNIQEILTKLKGQKLPPNQIEQ